MKEFPNNSNIKTNHDYFRKFKRVVYGTVVLSSKGVTVVKVTRQEGKAIPDYEKKDAVVIMITDDLELDNSKVH